MPKSTNSKVNKKYIIELVDTINYMVSTDYKDRFLAEYHQLKIRCDKLRRFICRIEAPDLSVNKIDPPKHDCSYDLLVKQLQCMENYLHLLEIRAAIENIEL